MTDRLISIKALKRGSYKAFNHLYEEYFPLLYGYIFDLTRSHQQTTELVQDTFIKVWINREKINEELSFKAWLFTLAKNQLYDQFRKQITSPLFEEYIKHIDDVNTSTDDPETALDFDSFFKRLEKSKSFLSPRQREVFELGKEDGYSGQEIAKKLGISEQAVYNYLSQSLKILREQLDAYKFLFLFFFYN